MDRRRSVRRRRRNSWNRFDPLLLLAHRVAARPTLAFVQERQCASLDEITVQTIASQHGTVLG